MTDIDYYIGQNTTIMKSLIKIIKSFHDQYYSSYFLLLFKYIPLILISHDWKILKSFGISIIFRKFTLMGYLDEFTNGYIINTILLILSLFNFTILIMFIIAFKKIKISAFHNII